MAQASSPASLRKKTTTRRLGSASTSNNNSGGTTVQGGDRVVKISIVQQQPSNLKLANSDNYNNNSGKAVVLHQWPNLDDLEVPQTPSRMMGEAMSDEDKAKFVYEVAKFGSAQGGAGEGGADSSLASYEDWLAMQKSLQSGSGGGGGRSPRINMDAHGYYLLQQQPRLTSTGADPSSSASSSSSSTGGGEFPSYEDWMTMQQVSPQKQVILRPLSSSLLDDPSNISAADTSDKKKTLSLPALGGTQNGGGHLEPEVYYYDANVLASHSSSSQSATPELTLPDEVYTASGQKLKLSDVHDGGKAEVYLEMNPQAVLGKSLNELNSFPKSSISSLSSTIARSNNAAGRQQSQDQMIVFLTVATMAIMVGMLSARRLRSRKFLEQCMTPDLEDDLDDVVRYDKKFDGNGRINRNSNRYAAAAGAAGYTYTTLGSSTLGGSPGRQSEYEGSETSLPHFSDLFPTSSSSILGSLSRRGGYGTTNETFGGGLHWRGDMEKFDV